MGKTTVHYEYAPFGEVLNFDVGWQLTNPWRFSSEYAEVKLATVYYNYRHYDPNVGRWMSRDPLSEVGCLLLTPAIKNFSKGIDSSHYQLVENNPIDKVDVIGLSPCNCHLKATCESWCNSEIAKEGMVDGYSRCNLTWFGRVMTCKCWGWCEDNFLKRPPTSKFEKWECAYRCGFRTAHFRLDRPCPTRFPLRLPRD